MFFFFDPFSYFFGGSACTLFALFGAVSSPDFFSFFRGHVPSHRLFPTFFMKNFGQSIPA